MQNIVTYRFGGFRHPSPLISIPKYRSKFLKKRKFSKNTYIKVFEIGSKPEIFRIFLKENNENIKICPVFQKSQYLFSDFSIQYVDSSIQAQP